MQGEVGDYLVAKIPITQNTVELFLYDDEAEVCVEKDYYVCEAPGFKTQEALIAEFGKRLQLALEKGKPY